MKTRRRCWPFGRRWALRLRCGRTPTGAGHWSRRCRCGRGAEGVCCGYRSVSGTRCLCKLSHTDGRFALVALPLHSHTTRLLFRAPYFRQFGKAAAAAGLRYIEEPVACPSDLPEFHRRTGLAVALDESVDEGEWLGMRAAGCETVGVACSRRAAGCCGREPGCLSWTWLRTLALPAFCLLPTHSNPRLRFFGQAWWVREHPTPRHSVRARPPWCSSLPCWAALSARRSWRHGRRSAACALWSAQHLSPAWGWPSWRSWRRRWMQPRQAHPPRSTGWPP